MAQASDTAQPQTPPRRDNPATVTDTNRLKALSHPTRLRILTVMSDTEPVTVGQIAEQLGESAGTVSYHLKQLEKAGFVTQTPSPDGDNRRSCWLAAQSRLEINADTAIDSAMATTMDQVNSTLRKEAWQRYRSASDNLPKQWTDPTVTSSSVLRLTSEEYAACHRSCASSSTHGHHATSHTRKGTARNPSCSTSTPSDGCHNGGLTYPLTPRPAPTTQWASASIRNFTPRRTTPLNLFKGNIMPESSQA